MKTIKIKFEYKCYPVWIYDEDGFVEDTALPPELAGDSELDGKFKSLQERFDATYVDTPTEFGDKGFATSEDEEAFYADLESAVADLTAACPEGYAIERKEQQAK